MYYATNPILPGFCPDPSICRVGKDYYLVTSSFAYFPGVPIFHSRDLAHWEQIGNVLDRESQLPLKGCRHSEGIFAPTIRYYNGTFYMITTNISAGGNFIVKAENPAGPWSEPFYLGEAAQGIDPSLFFDEDGTCYYVGTRPNQKGVRYNGDWEIWLQQLDVEKMQFVGESKKIWKGAMHHGIWPEGPHLYKKGEYYYLMHAEGGTAENHAISVARSKDIWGRYEGCPNNPIFTHRHLGMDYPITAAGHGDLVDDGADNWYVVMLASRKCEGYVTTGRDTYLAKVSWENDWPVINPGVGKLEEKVELPGTPDYKLPEKHCWHFYDSKLPVCFVRLRNPKEDNYCLTEQKGALRLRLGKERLLGKESPSYLGVRQQEYDYCVTTMMEFCTKAEQEEAGIAILCDEKNHYRFVKHYKNNKPVISLISCLNEEEKVLAEQEIPEGRIELIMVSRQQKSDWYVKTEAGEQICLANQITMCELSTEKTGGFTGCTIGMYASSNGMDTTSYADFLWFGCEKC